MEVFAYARSVPERGKSYPLMIPTGDPAFLSNNSNDTAVFRVVMKKVVTDPVLEFHPYGDNEYKVFTADRRTYIVHIMR